MVPVIEPNILPEGAWMILWGEEETFKSWLVLELAWAVSQGKPWLQYPTRKHNVLLINTELPKPLYHQRAVQMGLTRQAVPDNIFIVTDLSIKLDTDAGEAQLATWVSQSQPGLVIIDNLYRTFQGNMNSGQEVNRFLDTISHIRERWGSAFVFVHHSRKTAYDSVRNQRVRQGVQDLTGSKYLANNASAIYEVQKLKSIGGNNAILLIPEKLTFSKSSKLPMVYEVDSDAQFHLHLPTP